MIYIFLALNVILMLKKVEFIIGMRFLFTGLEVQFLENITGNAGIFEKMCRNFIGIFICIKIHMHMAKCIKYVIL